MAAQPLDQLMTEITAISAVQPMGRVAGVMRGMVQVAGLVRAAALGDGVRLRRSDGQWLRGEVLALGGDQVTVLTDGSADGVALQDPVYLTGQGGIWPTPGWIGRIIDPYGQPLDGRALPRGAVEQGVKSSPPAAVQRRRLGGRLETGLAAFDTLLPMVRGQRMGLFAGSGVGKSMLLADLARGVQADLVVIALIGERGRELREFVEDVLGPAGMERAVIVAATSDQSALTRRRCAWTAMAVAEYFRDQGRHVLFLADSLTRFAEAHREVALAAGEAASLRGYPPSTAQQIMSLAERSGPGPEGAGDITAIFSVLVAGSDMEEPVADILRGTLDGHVVLDRAIAERGRFPAVNLLRSVSRSLPAAANVEENRLIQRARHLLGAYERAEMMIQAGLYAHGSDPIIDAALACWPGLDGFLSEKSPGGVSESFALLAQCLLPGEAAPQAATGQPPRSRVNAALDPVTEPRSVNALRNR